MAALASLFFAIVTFFVVTCGLFLFVKLFQGLGAMVSAFGKGISYGVAHVLRYVRGTIVDTVHFTGSLITGLVILALALLNLLCGRIQSAKHYGRAFEHEVLGAVKSLYRVGIGHPARLVFLGRAADVFERRAQDVVRHAPRGGPRQPGVFDGYEVLGTLPSGGSGAQLFLARPRARHAAQLSQRHPNVPDRVVIKSFMLGLGSTLPQMIREGRALEAARRLGLLVEHQLSDTSFYYVMPYVDGEELGPLTDRLHDEAKAEGLGEGSLRMVLGWGSDLLRALERFHTGGLWHKDIKPANVIVADGRAHLVDFGLVTPLASGMTLTTHGTEFYRDPEMVRLAMRGVKVNEVDGVKFDLYSLGALLFSMVEGQFPAHGSLSRITKRCPEALRYVIRRAMADLDSRYSDANAMRADLEVLRQAADVFAVRPVDLPSMGGDRVPMEDEPLPTPGGEFLTPEVDVQPLKKRPRRRLRKVAIAGGALAAGVVALVVHEGRMGAERFHRVSYERDLAMTRDVEAKTRRQSLEQDLRRAVSSVPGELLQAVERDDIQPTFYILSDSAIWHEHSNELDAYAELYQQLGFRVLGVPGNEESLDELRLMTDARYEVLHQSPHDREAQTSLSRFLERTEDLDGVMWVDRDSNGEAIHTTIFHPMWGHSAQPVKAPTLIPDRSGYQSPSQIVIRGLGVDPTREICLPQAVVVEPYCGVF